jgi:hypothetical protein
MYVMYNFVLAAPPALYMEGATCVAYGFPLPHILWFNGTTGSVISNSSSVVIMEYMWGVFAIRSSIVVMQSLPSNSGVLYHCGAMNSEGNTSLLEDVASCPDSKTYCNTIVSILQRQYEYVVVSFLTAQTAWSSCIILHGTSTSAMPKAVFARCV